MMPQAFGLPIIWTMHASASIPVTTAPATRPLLSTLIDAAWDARTGERFPDWEQLVAACRQDVARALSEAETPDFPADAVVALLLARGYQRLRQDIAERGRVTLPQDIADRHGLSLGALVEAVKADVAAGDACGCARVGTAGVRAVRPAFSAALADAVGRTRRLLSAAQDMPADLSADARRDARLCLMRGEALLNAIQRRGGDTLRMAPAVGWATDAILQLRARWGG